MAGTEAAQFKALLAGFDVIDRALNAARPEAPRYSPETQQEMDRERQQWIRSARPTDSDWEVQRA